jgi:hypothetical protein
LWTVHGLYSYKSSRDRQYRVFEIGAAPVREIGIENGVYRVDG